MARKNITEAQAQKALKIVAEYLGRRTFNGGPVPTDDEAMRHGVGVSLRMDWDWPGEPTPTILGEGFIIEEWAYGASMNERVTKELDAIGVFVEPYHSFTLCLYPND